MPFTTSFRIVTGASPPVTNAASNITASIVQGSSSPNNLKFYDPSIAKGMIGSTVTWINKDNTIHTVSSNPNNTRGIPSDVFESKTLLPGQIFQHTFNDAGTFDYYCTIHPFMKGKVEITGVAPKSEKLIEVSPTTAITLNESKTYNLNIGGKIYPLTYQITGAGNKLNNITQKVDNTRLLVNTVSQSNGKLIIELPRNLIDSKQGNADEPYAVYIDGQPTAADEINTNNNSQVRTLAIDFDKGTGQIQIAGNVSDLISLFQKLI